LEESFLSYIQSQAATGDYLRYCKRGNKLVEGRCCLCQIAKIIKSSVRKEDVVCRYGGDEFVVLLPRTHPSRAEKIAEEKGYRTIIEKPTPDDSGRVDVSLEKNGREIACEISVTSTCEQELSNIEKCLKAGYERDRGFNRYWII